MSKHKLDDAALTFPYIHPPQRTCVCSYQVLPDHEQICCAICSSTFHMRCIANSDGMIRQMIYDAMQLRRSPMLGSLRWFCDQCSYSISEFKSNSATSVSSVSDEEGASSSTRTSKRHTSSHRGACKPPVPANRIWRRWNRIPDNPSTRTSPASSHHFSVISYNILAKTLLKKNSWLYDRCDQSALNWPFRWSNLSQEIKSFNSDIICLQEVEGTDLEKDIRPYLESIGYVTHYKKRTGNLPDGVLIAVKTNNFEVLDVVPVNYFRAGDPLTDRENVGLICVVQMKSTDITICVCNTHLLYNPKRGDVKLVQLCTFLAEIDRVVKQHASKHNKLPAVVICGDFNSTPFSPIYEFVTAAKLVYNDLCMQELSGQGNGNYHPKLLPVPLLPDVLDIDKDCRFQEKDKSGRQQQQQQTRGQAEQLDTIRHQVGEVKSCNDQHRGYEATTTQDEGITVDYIFYSSANQASVPPPSSSSDADDVSFTELTLKMRLSIPTSEEVARVGSIPNQIHPSDHLPVAARFTVNSHRQRQPQPKEQKQQRRARR